MANRIMWIAWPAFLAACVLELVVFAVADPGEFEWAGHALPMTRQGVYTLAFFVFWAICGVSNAITVLLSKSAAELNQCPYRPGERPASCPAEQPR